MTEPKIAVLLNASIRPDVPQALQTGIITGLDHTPIGCNISGKFNVAKNYIQLDDAQGLYIHLTKNKCVLNSQNKERSHNLCG